jgi:hypothetical protein
MSTHYSARTASATFVKFKTPGIQTVVDSMNIRYRVCSFYADPMQFPHHNCSSEFCDGFLARDEEGWRSLYDSLSGEVRDDIRRSTGRRTG